ncbi:S-adenosyl-L-methionine-dependent methyltransferase, partial [Rhodocollybia butyracea]
MLPRQELKWLKKAALGSNRPLQSLIRRRQLREPLQYIIGTQPFAGLELRVRSPILIPRPETEDWVLRFGEYLSRSARRPRSLLDLGTGTGCIPLLLCHMWPDSLVATGVDISPHAVQLANENAALCGISRFQAHTADFLHPLFPTTMNGPPFDILTSNPPYITASEYLQLSDDVAKFEDPAALIGGHDGLEYYRAITDLIARDGFLSSDAVVALEVGHEQADAVCNMIRPKGYETSVWLDPWGKKRTVVAHR